MAEEQQQRRQQHQNRQQSRQHLQRRALEPCWVAKLKREQQVLQRQTPQSRLPRTLQRAPQRQPPRCALDGIFNLHENTKDGATYEVDVTKQARRCASKNRGFETTLSRPLYIDVLKFDHFYVAAVLQHNQDNMRSCLHSGVW